MASKTSKTASKAKPAKALPKKAAVKTPPAKAQPKPAAKPVAPKAASKKVPAKKAAPKKAAPAKAPAKAAAKSPAKPVKKAVPTPKKAVPNVKSSKNVKAAPAAAAKPEVKSPAAKATATKAVASKPVAAKAAPAQAAPAKSAPKKAGETAAPAKKPAAAATAAPAPSPTPAPTPTPSLTPRVISKEKVLGQDFLMELAQSIKDAVAPVARSLKGRDVVSTTISGDACFELDRVAEKTLLNFLRQAKAPVAYYSEESGYSTFSNAQPKHLLVVDPVDGTRAAKNGFEGCVICIASTRVIERPRVGDLDNAVVMEILGDHAFFAERGKGARMYEAGHQRKIKLSDNTNLESISWSMTVPARPAELIFPTAARLIDLSSLKGGFFACNSTSYSLTRLLTGQHDACIDIANRYMRDIPDIVRDQFINAGRGNILGIAPYDLVSALLIAEEAGAVVTDAYGKRFDDVLLLDSSELNQLSLIAASNATLHKKLLSFFDTRILQFEALLKRRAGIAATTDN